MTFISYAQNFEDVMLWRALGHIERGFYIDVGAAHPDEHSVTRAFYDRGWTGINIEPLPSYFRMLAGARQRDLNLNIALAQQAGDLPFFEVEGTGLSTLDARTAGERRREGRTVHEANVQVRTLNDIVREHATGEVHFLKIDVEGSERAVLEGADFSVSRPWIILVESTRPLSTAQNYHEWQDLLEAAEYRFAWFDGLNRFYIAAEHWADLSTTLAIPPNVFDDFIRVGDTDYLSRIIAAETRAGKAEAEAAQAAIRTAQADVRAAHAEARAGQAEADMAQAHVRLGQAEAEKAQANQAAAEAARAAELLSAEIAQLRVGLEAASAQVRGHGELVQMHDATTHQLAREVESRRAAEMRSDQACGERDALLASTAWRMTWPLRWFGTLAPGPARWHTRRALKAAWWAATPWRVAHRLRAIRERSAEQARIVAPLHDRHQPPALVSPPQEDADPYARWIAEIEAAGRPPAAGASARSFGEARFSFLIARPDQPSALMATLNSLRAQANPDWELLIAAPESKAWGSEKFAAIADQRITTVSCRTSDLGDKGAALAMLLPAAKGSYVAVLDPGDLLAPDALDEAAHALAHAPGAAIFYSDEDEISAKNTRTGPQFKPSWSPELLHSYNYFGRLTLLRRSLAIRAGGFTPGTGAAAEWDLNLRTAKAAHEGRQGVARIPRVLCHRAAGGDRDRPAPSSAAAAHHRDALRAYWAACGIQGPRIETQPDGTQRSTWYLPEPPLVSVIVPNRDSPQLIRQCIDGLLNRTDYAPMEIIIVDNRSGDPATFAFYEELRSQANLRIVSFDRPFNYSAAVNRGAANARGALLLFLNNDIEVTDRGWLGELVRVASCDGVGVVGTKLRYPTGELQHAGVAVGVHLFGLMFRHARESEWGVFGSTNHPRNWLAIMGACQMVRREVFAAVGGFDESYHIANSDVALCLRAYRLGWRTAYTPFAELIHHEGASRGRTNPNEDMASSAAELLRLGLTEDPYFHPNLAPDPIPRLRRLGEPNTRENLANDIEWTLATVPGPEPSFDPFDDSDAISAAGLSRDFILWPPQPVATVADRWSTARWVIDLLRTRPDLRARFPRALSAGADGPFAAWLKGEGGSRLGLSPEAMANLHNLFADDLSARPRQIYFLLDDLRTNFALGLLPAGRRGLASWMLRNGGKEEKLRPEEIWWFIIKCAEYPAGELVRTYLFTPAWQEAHPDGLTIFGRDSFAAWLSHRYRLSADAAAWLDPASWPVRLAPAQQIRLAYAARDEWRAAHPRALETKRDAGNLLAWLAGPNGNLPAEVRTWCAERAEDGTASALAAAGVNIIAHFCYPSGLRVSADAISDGLELAGVQVSRRDLRTDRGDDPHHTLFGGLEVYDISIIHAQPEPFFETAFQRADLAERSPRTYRIAYWYWELEAVPEWWAEKARAVNEIWAATTFVAGALKKAIPSIPVLTMFPGVQIGPFRRRRREAFGLPAEEGRFAFLFSFHMSSIMERKNPLALMRAFKQAFRPDEPADLIIKSTSFGRYDAQLSELRDAAAGANIIVMDRVLTPDETLSLMDCCDAYASLHRSEGLGLTMAEAMLLGKPVIATRYSGNLDFMDDNNSLLVDCDIVPLGRPVPPYDASGQWAEPSVEHAAQLMRRVYENREWSCELGAKAQADARDRLSLEKAGRWMAARLAEIEGAKGRHG